MSENHFIFFANSKINKEIRQNQWWVADDIGDDVLQWLVNLNSSLRPKLSRLVSVFGLSKRLIQKVKWARVSCQDSIFIVLVSVLKANISVCMAVHHGWSTGCVGREKIKNNKTSLKIIILTSSTSFFFKSKPFFLVWVKDTETQRSQSLKHKISNMSGKASIY